MTFVYIHCDWNSQDCDSMNPYSPPTETDDRQPKRASTDQIPEWAAICGFQAMIVWSIWLG